MTLAVHYRRSRRRAEARRCMAVLNLCPIETPTKAAAVEDLPRRLTAPMVLYIGDDVTHEDAFRSPAVRVSIRVGASDDSAARYCLASREDVDAPLEALVVERARAARVAPLRYSRCTRRQDRPDMMCVSLTSLKTSTAEISELDGGSYFLLSRAAM